MADALGEINQEVKKWLAELAASRKREEHFRKEGRRIAKIYDAEKGEGDKNPYNVLYSNTETLLPALYNNTPRPTVQRRYKDADPIGKLAAQVTERSLAFLIDSNDQDYSDFDDMMKSAVLEALLPGRGWTRFKYDATFSGEGDAKKVTDEQVCGEEVPWDRMLLGYAKKWKDVPWLAIEHFMNKEEVERNFGGEIAAAMAYSIVGGQEDEASDGEQKSTATKDSEEVEHLAHIYEIWDKTSKKVIFIGAGYPQVIKQVDDPLGLSGFFPGPRPLQFTAKVSNILPTALYTFYEHQAKELNTCTKRIASVMKALKVRGFYDATLSGIDKLLEAADNTLLPAENVSAMIQGQTLEKAIWLMPLNELVGVLQQLYLQRQQVKDVIYEITGISDILRGASVASETATAQNIKNQWGTLRLKKAQKEVQRYVRDCLRIMAEIAVTKLDAKKLSAMTGIQLPTKEQQDQAKATLAQLQQQQALQVQQGGQPAPVPPQAQQLQKMLGMPNWETILELLRNQIQRHYRIDIETNSTVDAEATEDKTDIAEFMNALSQFLNGVGPVMEQGMMTFDVAKAMLLSIVRRFRFGTEVEDQIDNMQAPPPPKQPGDDPKTQAETAKLQIQTKADEAEAQHKQQMMELEFQKAQMDMELKREEMQLKREEMMSKRALAQAQHQHEMQALNDQAALRQQQHAASLQEVAQRAALTQAQGGNGNADL